MMKSITASLLFAASLGQSPPAQANPAAPAIPANPNPEYVPVQPVEPEVPAVPVETPQATAPGLALLPPGEFYGAFNQICVPDPLKDVLCKTAGAAAVPQYPGFLKCERSYDCCLCGSVTCGDYYQGCNTFSAGDSGVKGVKDIHIIGRPEQLGGGEMLCIGIESCADTVMKGERIKSLDGAGALSLRNAQVSLLNPVADFNIDCVGMGACENAKIEILIEGPPAGFQCNPAIDPHTIEFNAIQCSGQESCKNMELTIRNEGCDIIEIQQIECILPNSCMGAQFNFIGAIEINNCDIRGGGAPPTGLEACYGGNPGNAPGTVPGGNPNWVPV